MPRIHLDADTAHQHFFMIYWFFNKLKNFQTYSFFFLMKLCDLFKNLKFMLIQNYLTILNSVVLCDMLSLRSGSVKPKCCGYNGSRSVKPKCCGYNGSRSVKPNVADTTDPDPWNQMLRIQRIRIRGIGFQVPWLCFLKIVGDKMK